MILCSGSTRRIIHTFPMNSLILLSSLLMIRIYSKSQANYSLNFPYTAFFKLVVRPAVRSVVNPAVSSVVKLVFKPVVFFENSQLHYNTRLVPCHHTSACRCVLDGAAFATYSLVLLSHCFPNKASIRESMVCWCNFNAIQVRFSSLRQWMHL